MCFSNINVYSLTRLLSCAQCPVDFHWLGTYGVQFSSSEGTDKNILRKKHIFWNIIQFHQQCSNALTKPDGHVCEIKIFLYTWCIAEISLTGKLFLKIKCCKITILLLLAFLASLYQFQKHNCLKYFFDNKSSDIRTRVKKSNTLMPSRVLKLPQGHPHKQRLLLPHHSMHSQLKFICSKGSLIFLDTEHFYWTSLSSQTSVCFLTLIIQFFIGPRIPGHLARIGSARSAGGKY